MSVLAMAEITISFERDIASVHRFYKISASSSTPADWTSSQVSNFISKGTIVSGWSLTEPAYDNSTTNSLYFFDLTVFSDDTYNKSNISKSSSYEAAKQAYEEALAAQYGTESLAAKVKNYWWDSTGAHIASGVLNSGETEPQDVTEGTPSTYGFNSLVGLSSLTFGYNSYKALELDGSNPSLKFYKPSKTAQGAQTAILNSNGLVLSEGGIEAGTKSSNNYIYIYSKDDSTNHNLSINNSGNKSDWRIIAGNKFGVDKAGNLYASNATISGTITVGSGSNVYTKTEANSSFDANGAASAAQAAAISAASSDATSKANAAQAAAISAAASDATSKANAAKESAITSAAADATSKANAVNDALELYKTATNSTLTSLQNQVDGQVEVWYYDVDPTTSNPPASSWNTTELKARHEGDLYYNIDNGHSWRWLKSGSTYEWQQIPDSDAAAALAKATNAETLAGNKRRIFTSQPTPPYDIGDLWVTGSQIKYCSSSKASGQSYASSDWTLTATDDTKANSAVYEEQYVYISKASGTTSVSKNETWVAESGDVQNTWTTKRPTYNTNYPVLFVAKQRKTVSQSSGNTCTCSTPVKDDTTTVIDGGHITTGTIDAARLNVNDIISSGSIAVTSDIPTNLSELTNDTNYITSSSVPTKVSELTNDSGFQNGQDVSGAINTATDGIKSYITNQGFAKSSDIPDISGLAAKSDSIYRTQRIYRRYTSSQSNLSGPSTWVIADTDIYNNWTTKIPPLTNGSTKYPYLYTCTQKQTISQYNSGATCTCSPVLLDSSTTVIDGGNIITGSIAANKLTVSGLSAISANLGSITAGSISNGNNSINFNNSPATLEFKNNSTWEASTQGIKYDSNGLSIKGSIIVTSGSNLSAGLTNYSTTSQISNTYTAKTDAVSRSQQIYYYALPTIVASGQSEEIIAPTTPNTTYIEDDKYTEKWINRRITYISDFSTRILEYTNKTSFPVKGEINKIYYDKSNDDFYSWVTSGNSGVYTKIDYTKSLFIAEYSSLSNLPATGDANKIYVVVSGGIEKFYKWFNSEYVEISAEQPNVWVCTQTEMANGDISCTTPVLDSISIVTLDTQDLINGISDTIDGEDGLSNSLKLLTGSIIIDQGDSTQNPPVEPSIKIQTNAEEDGSETGKASLNLTSTKLTLDKNDVTVITLDSTVDDGAVEANEIIVNSGLRLGDLEIIPYNGGIGVRRYEE